MNQKLEENNNKIAEIIDQDKKAIEEKEGDLEKEIDSKQKFMAKSEKIDGMLRQCLEYYKKSKESNLSLNIAIEEKADELKK